MKASPAEQQELLRLQSLDTRLQQLAHRLGSLPQAAPLAELATRDTAVRGTRAEAIGGLEDARAELKRLESDVAVVEARIARDGDRLQHTSSVKDVAALESELASLRQAPLRPRGPGARRHGARGGRPRPRSRASTPSARRSRPRSRPSSRERDDAAAGLATERDAAERDRGVVAGGIPADLLALYEQRRARGGGVGAALLSHRACGGCTITLTGSAFENVRRAAPDDVLLCPECDRILVRTDESGI